MAKYSGIFTTSQQMQAAGANNWTTVPGAPTSVTATAGDQSASVSFTAPTFTGNPAGISSYIVTSSPGGFTASGSASPITVTGLTNGTAYTFTVQAIGTFTGPGAISSPSNSVTPAPPFVDDVFSTWLYTGNGSTQTITNGIDLAGEGGMAWRKTRSGNTAFGANMVSDTIRGTNNVIRTSETGGQSTANNTLTAFNANGFSLGASSDGNNNGDTYVSWTFRKQPKFFDVVTYTGNGSTQTINHNLGSVPGCIIIKSTSNSTNWFVYHRALNGGVDPQQYYVFLNNTSAQGGPSTVTLNNTAPTSTTFSLGNTENANANGYTYVAYLFAHNAGGFGTAGTDNVISCGSFTTDGSTGLSSQVNLGYEPQWILVKNTDTAFDNNWQIIDNMRGWVNGSAVDSADDKRLYPNTSGAEATAGVGIPNATGFVFSGAVGATYIYIAIRRTMKPPTSGTGVFQPVAYTGAGEPTTVNSSNQIDFYVGKRRGPTFSDNTIVQDRLRGSVPILVASDSRAEEQAYNTTFSRMTGIIFNVNDGATTTSGANYINWGFTRKTQFMDEVCYTGTGVARTVAHNLGAVPELIIVKGRNLNVDGWPVYAASQGANKFAQLSNTDVPFFFPDVTMWNNTTPTSSVFSVGTQQASNGSGINFVAYLFATLAGVSKVGTYTGTGGTQSINAGFTGGARFLLAKRADAPSGWFCWDSARGFTSGSSPYLLWNNGSSAETTGNNGTYASTGGFTLTSGSPVNDNGGSYIYLAIA